MKNDNEEDEDSTSSSPIPVSTGPYHHKYSLSSLPSPSPPLTPPGSSNTSTENLCLLHDSNLSETQKASDLSSFSIHQCQPAEDSSSQSSSCFMKLLEWFALRCCSCCAWNLNSALKLRHS